MIKVVKTERQYSSYQYKRYTDADKHFLKIEKTFDSPWADWEVTVPFEMSYQKTIVSSPKFDEIRKFLSKFNSVEELIGVWFINGKKPFTI